MTKTEIYDNIGLVSGQINDISCLAQEIRDDYFNQYNSDSENGKMAIVWDYDKYASLYRIMENSLYEAAKILKNIKNNLNV